MKFLPLLLALLSTPALAEDGGDNAALVERLTEKGPKGALGRPCAKLDGIDLWGGLASAGDNVVEATGVKLRCGEDGTVQRAILTPEFTGELPKGTTWDMKQKDAEKALDDARLKAPLQKGKDPYHLTAAGRVVTTWRWDEKKGTLAKVVFTPGFEPIERPRTVPYNGRHVTYTDLELNGIETSAYVASPGESIDLELSWSLVTKAGDNYCPTCVIQIYVGLGSQFSTCIENKVLTAGTTSSGKLATTFEAPREPGIYLITQATSLQYECVKVEHKEIENRAIATIAVR